MNLEGKINGEVNIRIQNISEFYHIIKGKLCNREIQKRCKITIYKVYFNQVLTYKNIYMDPYKGKKNAKSKR